MLVSCLPDTGCSQTILSSRLARQLGLRVNKNNEVQLYTANGGNVNIEGTCEVLIKNDDIQVTSTVIVAPHMSHSALISWHDMVALKMISRSFPARVASLSAGDLKDYIFKEFPTVFNDQLNEFPMKTEPANIELKEGAIPFRVSVARQIPLRFTEPAEKAIQELLRKGVIVQCNEPTEWCSPAFFVVKPDGKSVRMVTDYTKLNKYVNRPVHPFPSVSDILQSIPASANYFAKFDAVNGYFQIPLTDKASKLTTFLLPSGRYRYLRTPQGLNASSDEWCRRSDAVIDGLLYARKIVDDILIWASSLEELKDRIRIIASRCESLNIVLSKKKFAIGQSMPFAGYIVTNKGVRPDPTRIQALRKFPTPTDVTGVKSFLGMANQLSMFIPDFTQITKSIRELLGKGKTFQWLPEHAFEFENAKRVLSESMLNRHFDPEKHVYLLTDASRHHGLGFALCQYDGEQPVIVTCGSKSLTPTQQRYATVELECLGIVWAMHKCAFYLRGLPNFTVVTDHRPLEGVFKKTMFDQANPRLRRMMEKLTAFTFEVKWVAGKTHRIADALSRAPVFPPDEDIDLQIDTALTCLLATSDPALSIVKQHIDSDYRQFAKDVTSGSMISKMSPFYATMKDRLSVQDDIVLLDAKRIVLPKDCIRPILKRLHEGHPGQEKSLRLASSLFYWPGFTNDVKTFVSSCSECFRKLPSQKQNPCITEPPSAAFGAPMAHVGVDLFDVAGKSHLVCVDKWSGYPMYQQLRSTTTSSIINVLTTWFNLLGWPKSLRSDGGPQFLSEFKTWCQINNIDHETSSPYNPKANGLAESAVKNVKHLLLKCKSTGEDPGKSLYLWRNIPRADGYSPAQLLFGRRQFTSLPAMPCAFDFYDIKAAQASRDKVFNSHLVHHDQNTGFLPDFLPGDSVVIQDSKSGDWNQRGVIISARRSGQSYDVRADGRTFIRSRRFLRKDPNPVVAATTCGGVRVSTPEDSKTSSWEAGLLNLSHPPSKTTAKIPVIPNQMGISIESSTNPVGPQSFNGTGPVLGGESPPSSSAWPSSSSSYISCERTGGQTVVPGDLNSMRCSFSLAGLSQADQPGVPTSREYIRPVQDILVPPWGTPGPQLEAGVSHLHHIPQFAPVAQAQLLPPASLLPQLQPPPQPPQPLLQLPPVQSVMVDTVSRDLVWCSDPTAQSCRPSQDCLNFKGCPQSPPVVMQGQASRPWRACRVWRLSISSNRRPSATSITPMPSPACLSI